MKLIPTKVHGVLDYLTVGTLLVLPGLLGWDETVSKCVRLAAVGTALYSVVTEYEWGAGPLKALPMAGHLACDGASGLLFCAGPLLLPDESKAVKTVLVGLGLFELLVTLNSQSQPAGGRRVMAQSFNTGEKRRVFVTGAAGRIGSYFAEHSHDRYDLRLMVRGDEAGIDAIRFFGEVVEGELSDLAMLKRFCVGIDTVVHMAGDPDPTALWDSLLHANIIGTYNIFAAAKAAGCRRVIHASSIHAVSGYPPDVQVKTSEPVNPGDLYGVSKCFGEALARYMAEQEGVSAISIRIGAFQPVEAVAREDGLAMLDAFVSERDLNQLLNRCIDVENVRFAILHGLSDNRFKRLDISDARELVGYRPQDDATALNAQVRGLHLSETLDTHSAIADGQASGLRGQV